MSNQLVLQLAGIHDVAVVSHGNLPVGAIDQDRLRVVCAAVARRGIADVPDGDMAGQLLERFFGECLVHVAHRFRQANLLAVGSGDAGALLTAMLQRIESEVREVRRLRMAEDAEDAAVVLKFVARHHAARCLKYFSSTESQMASASCTDTSITGRPPTDRRSRLPPVDPISLAGTPAARARSSNTESCERNTYTTTRDADSENTAAASDQPSPA